MSYLNVTTALRLVLPTSNQPLGKSPLFGLPQLISLHSGSPPDHWRSASQVLKEFYFLKIIFFDGIYTINFTLSHCQLACTHSYTQNSLQICNWLQCTALFHWLGYVACHIGLEYTLVGHHVSKFHPLDKYVWLLPPLGTQADSCKLSDICKKCNHFVWDHGGCLEAVHSLLEGMWGLVHTMWLSHW